nr:hypothetical protein Q903MT_gene369 [Picea sitchensis]
MLPSYQSHKPRLSLTSFELRESEEEGVSTGNVLPTQSTHSSQHKVIRPTLPIHAHMQRMTSPPRQASHGF